MKLYILRMKKLFGLVGLVFSCWISATAQNEGRLGLFFGINKTTINNADDVAQGDMLPTFKPTIGVSGDYRFTVAKKLPLGIMFQFANNKLGQNYRGYYQDTTSYWAYSRLTYLRGSLGFIIGSNPRRLVSVNMTNGISFGLLTKFQERYELVRYNNDRIILDIENTSVTVDDTLVAKGTISAPLYNKSDLTYFFAIGGDFLLSRKLVFGMQFRVDMGLSSIENITDYTMYFNTEPVSTTVTYKPYNKTKFRAAQSATETRGDTKNSFAGVYLSLKYRIYNEDKYRMYYNEHRHDWY